MSTIATLHRKRGVVRASITKLSNKLTEIKELADQEESLRHAQRLSTRLNTLDGDFKTHHFNVIAAIDEDNEAHAAEQAVIDKHDEEVNALTVRLKTLLVVLTSPDVSEERKLLLRRLQHIKETLDGTMEAIDGLSSDLDNPALIQAHEEELSSLKEQIALCYNALEISCIKTAVDGEPIIN